jgi:hypothetical protein
MVILSQHVILRGVDNHRSSTPEVMADSCNVSVSIKTKMVVLIKGWRQRRNTNGSFKEIVINPGLG